MSVQGDNELRDLVSQTLENAGILSKIRAELRASVFLVLEEHEAFEGRNISFTNKPLKEFLSTNEGVIIVTLVREFLDYFGLEFTASVFDSETQSGDSYEYLGRKRIAQDLKLNSDTKVPLIAQVLQESKINCSDAVSFHKEELRDSIKKEKSNEEKKNQNNNHTFFKSEVLTSHLNGSMRSPENSIKDISFKESKSPTVNSHHSFQSLTKKPDNLKLDLNQQNSRPGGNSLSSLGGLPPLGFAQHNLTNRTVNNTRHTKQVSNDIKTLLNFGCDSPEQNYEEDFHPSGSEKTAKGTNRSLSGSGSEVEEEVSVGVDDHTSDVSGAGSNTSEKTGDL